MQTFVVELESPVSKSFRCQKAANSLDIDTAEKSRHRLEAQLDLVSPYHVGLVLGSSGSGKSTLAHKIQAARDGAKLVDSLPVIDQLPPEWSYDECAAILAGLGLTSVPCWIRPVYTLSNGQRARAEAAFQLAYAGKDLVIIDEWTSVVDRTVAKAMSQTLQKYARREGKQIILLSCHYDIIEWLDPDWTFDCNTASYVDRRLMVGTQERTDRLRLEVRSADKRSWSAFARYHYLSSVLPRGRIYTYGLFDGDNQIGFVCFAAYIVGDQRTFFSNRLVVHPDYVGLGLGLPFVNAASRHMLETKRADRILAKFSSIPAQRMRERSDTWRLIKTETRLRQGVTGRSSRSGKAAAIRSKVKTWTWQFCG